LLDLEPEWFTKKVLSAEGNRLWIFTKHGFFSAVCARQSNGEQGQPVDLERITP
jgi:hypothetical protein